MRRGFKALAERNAVSARQALGLAPNAPLEAYAYAKHLDVLVLDLRSLDLTAQAIQQLTVKDSDSWSAMTLQDHGVTAVVVNPAHADTRTQNDLMHELSHIKLGHKPARVEVSKSGLMLLSDFSEEQEQEADWQAAALLLPREGILELRSRSVMTLTIAQHYGVSPALCEWRLRMTGVEVQLRRRGATTR